MCSVKHEAAHDNKEVVVLIVQRNIYTQIFDSLCSGFGSEIIILNEDQEKIQECTCVSSASNLHHHWIVAKTLPNLETWNWDMRRSLQLFKICPFEWLARDHRKTLVGFIQCREHFGILRLPLPSTACAECRRQVECLGKYQYQSSYISLWLHVNHVWGSSTWMTEVDFHARHNKSDISYPKTSRPIQGLSWHPFSVG